MHQFIAHQLKQPSGWFGKLITARFLNRVNAPINSLMFSCLDPKPTDQILEIGFGGGDLMSRMVQNTELPLLAGLDFSPEMVAFCKQRFRNQSNVVLSCGSVEAIPYPSNFFSKIGTVNTIYFWPDLKQALQECWRVLQKEGSLTIGFASKLSLQKSHKITQHGFIYYEMADVEAVVKAIGFQSLQFFSGSAHGETFFCAQGIK